MTLATKVKDLTGPGHTDRFGIGGTDLGTTTTAPDGRLVSVFGDTFARPTVGGRGWRSPVALFGDPASVRSGLEWTGAAGPDGYAAQLLPYRHGARIEGKKVITKLPTDVLCVGGVLYLHVMVCRELGNVHWTELHQSVDNGLTWQPTGTRWPGALHGDLFQMLTWSCGDDGFVYAFTSSFRRENGLLLHRVPQDALTDPAAWQSWGDAGWGTPPVVVVPGRFGELSLRWVQDRWLLAAFDEEHYRMDVFALGPPAQGPCVTARSTVLQGCSWDAEDHARGHVAQLYGGYILPGSTPADLHLVVSQWNTAKNWPYRAMQFRADVSRTLA